MGWHYGWTYFAEGPVDPGYGVGTPMPPHVGGGPVVRPPHVGGGPVFERPVDPGYGRPIFPHVPVYPGGPVDPGWGVGTPLPPHIWWRPGFEGPVDPGWGVRPPVDPGYGHGRPLPPTAKPPIYIPPSGENMPEIPGGPGFWVYAPATGDWYWVPLGEGGKPKPPSMPPTAGTPLPPTAGPKQS